MNIVLVAVCIFNILNCDFQPIKRIGYQIGVVSTLRQRVLSICNILFCGLVCQDTLRLHFQTIPAVVDSNQIVQILARIRNRQDARLILFNSVIALFFLTGNCNFIFAGSDIIRLRTADHNVEEGFYIYILIRVNQAGHSPS